MILSVQTVEEVDEWVARIEKSTAIAMSNLAEAGSHIEALRKIKFEPIGRHPVEDRPLNLIEQVNQTFTYLVALQATRWLITRHPDALGFHLAPGADMARPLDIMSEAPN